VQTVKATDLVETELARQNGDLAKTFAAEVLVLRTPMAYGVDDQIREYVEGLKQRNAKTNKLCVLLETTGGYIEVVERIYAVFRKHYAEVVFVVPNYAYSAGTVLVMSGDEIYMDYYAVLGPIDPQFEAEDGKGMLPGIGYLHKFDELVKTINDKQKNNEIVAAEMAYLVRKFDPTKLFQIEQSRDHSARLLKEWLPKHKFKNWGPKTQSGKVVDQAYKEARAAEIAAILGEPKRWHSHGRGIGRRDLEGEEIKLRIQDLDQDQALNNMIQEYYSLFIDFCGKQGIDNALHGQNGVRVI
jgi:hypothetical protein